MRLLNVKTLTLDSFASADDAPPYAILSHTWGPEEVTFEELDSPSAQTKAGYEKIRQTCSAAANLGFSHAWIDTCCIDKQSSSELSEAINSMFQWYRKSQICWAYLDDIQGEEDLRGARWFTRGWTLQELLAPRKVVFVNRTWEEIGDRRSLVDEISSATGIDRRALYGESNLQYTRSTSIAKRMSWAALRETTREEDLAYCLLGLFDVNMPLLYGEGAKAFFRLQEEIMRGSADQSIFAWGSSPSGSPGSPEPASVALDTRPSTKDFLPVARAIF